MINNFNPGFDREKAAFIELANRGAGLTPINYLYAKEASFESILSPIINGGTAELYTIYGKGIYSVNITNSEDIITSRLKWTNPFNNYYAGFIAGNLTQNTIWRLPLHDGNEGEVLSTNGMGSLSFINVTTGAAPIDARYILQIPNEKLPNAQALSKLSNGLMKNNGGVIQIAVANKDYLTPSLAYGKLWIGNSSNVAAQVQTISSDNLPNLNYGKLWLGNINNRPEASSTINSSNLPDLSEGKVWQGDFSNRPIEVDIKLSPTDATYIIQTPNPDLTEAQVLSELGMGMAKLLEGGVFAIAVPGEDYVTTEELEEIEEQCKEYASKAQGSADAAASSAEEAATSAEEAASSATEASASAGEASTAAGEATTAAGEATASAGAASASAVAAAASAGTAAYYADDASDYADDAYGYSEDASDSADDAGNHADSASKSASKASSSASSAADSASDAKDYLDKLLNTGLNELPCSGDVSLNNYKLINVAIPTLVNDGANKGYVDSAIGTIPATEIVLQGDIKGSGPIGLPIDTVLVRTLNQITNAGDIDVGNFLITNLQDPVKSSDASTKNYVDTKTWITAQITDFKTEVAAFSLDQFSKPNAALDINSQVINNLASPVNANDATTKSYVDTAIGNIPETDLILQGDIKGAGPLSAPVTTMLMKTLNQIENAGDIDVGNYLITNLKDPIETNHAATKIYVDSKTWTTTQITDFNATVMAFRLDQFAKPIISLDLNTQVMNNLGAPLNPNDAATKSYVDTAVGNIPAAEITLQGDIKGCGPLNSPIDTVLTKTLNQIENAGNIDMSNFLINNLKDPIQSNDAATKSYIDTHTWITTDITDFSSAVTAFRLDQFAKPTTSIDLNSQKIMNVGIPNNTNDATNKNYVDTHTWLSSQITDFNTAVVAFKLNQFAKPNAALDLNSQIIINLGSPMNANDAATKNYVDTAVGNVPATQITLQGDVKGSGPLSSPINTTLVKTLNQITNAGDINIGNYFITNLKDPTQANYAATKNYVDVHTWLSSQITDFNTAVTAFSLDRFAKPNVDLNFNNRKVTSLADPISSSDATTKNYVDSMIASEIGNFILQGFVLGGPAIEGIIQTSRGPTCLLCNIPAGGDVSMDNFSIRNLADMPPQLDEASEQNAINFEFLFKLLNDEII